MSWKPQGGGPWGGGNGGRGNNPCGGGQGSAPIHPISRKCSAGAKTNLEDGSHGWSRRLSDRDSGPFGLGRRLAVHRRLHRETGPAGRRAVVRRIRQNHLAGARLWFPAPIGEKEIVDVSVTQTTVVGFSTNNRTGRSIDRPQESLMITGDQNIIDMDFVVQWNIKAVENYLFNILDPESTVKAAAESAMREIVGCTPLEGTLTQLRGEVQNQTKNLLQQILDSYGAGINVIDVKLQQVDPPQPVIDAFNDVQRPSRTRNAPSTKPRPIETTSFPGPRGEAQKMIQGATAYAKGHRRSPRATRGGFCRSLRPHKLNKDVTKRRIYLERIQEILANTEKIIIDQGRECGQGVVPYLPLNELKRGQGGQ